MSKIILSKSNPTYVSQTDKNIVSLRREYEMESISIKCIEISGIVNPSDLALRLVINNERYRLDFFRHKHKMVLQNGIFLLNTEDIQAFEISLMVDSTSRTYSTFEVYSECSTGVEYEIVLYYAPNLATEYNTKFI